MNKRLSKIVKDLEPSAKFVTTWNGYDVYLIPDEDESEDEDAMVGRPEFMLAKEGDIRFATVDERDDIMAKMPNQ